MDTPTANDPQDSRKGADVESTHLWWYQPAQGFNVTRRELAMLAAEYHKRAEGEKFNMAELGQRYLEDLGGIDAAHARLDEIEEYLGPQALASEYEFAQAQARWIALFQTLREEERACKRQGPGAHCHGDCIELAIETSGMFGKWPDLTPEQARMIFERKLFIGMTKDQLEKALGFLIQTTTWSTTPEVMTANWHPEHLPGPSDRVWLVLENNRLVRIENTDPGVR